MPPQTRIETSHASLFVSLLVAVRRYLDGLLGPWPAAEKVYKERSPIEALDKFDKPIAFFQVGLSCRPILTSAHLSTHCPRAAFLDHVAREKASVNSPAAPGGSAGNIQWC